MSARNERWGLRLQEALALANVSHRSLAKRLGVRTSTVSGWCSGIVPRNGVNLLPRISRELHFPVAKLIP